MPPPRRLLIRLLSLAALAAVALAPVGCAPADKEEPIVDSGQGVPPQTQPAQSDAHDRVVALVNGRPIMLSQVVKPLLEAHGLDILLELVQLEMARQEAQKAGVTVNDKDLADERLLMLKLIFPTEDPDQYETLLAPMLANQHITQSQFDMVVRTNAYLRKLAEPQIEAEITPQTIKAAFNALYGEKVKVRHIEVATVQLALEAKHRVMAGEPFEKVAREMSINARTAAQGGELPEFSRATQGLSETFKETAFTLAPGEVSDPVQSGNTFHVIQLVARIPPEAVKLDAVKDSVRRRLYDSLAAAKEKELRAVIGSMAMRVLKIEDPILRKEFDERIARQQMREKDENEVRHEILNPRSAGAATRAGPPRPATQGAPKP